MEFPLTHVSRLSAQRVALGLRLSQARLPKVHNRSARLSRNFDVIASPVVQHLTGLLDAKVTITVEIEAEIPIGAPDNVVRTVAENCRTLKFENSGFEES